VVALDKITFDIRQFYFSAPLRGPIQRYYDAATVINAVEQTTGVQERRSSNNRLVCPARKLNNRENYQEFGKSKASQEITMDLHPVGLWYWCWKRQQQC
jgi:hypothetical protein